MPWFISGPTEGDPLYVMTTIMVFCAVIGIGVLFFTLHSLPERLGHKKLQFEIVAVLGLLSLLTHIHIFWVAALLLALVDLPDFLSPLKRMAGALEKLSGTPPEPDPVEPTKAVEKSDTPQAVAFPEPAVAAAAGDK